MSIRPETAQDQQDEVLLEFMAKVRKEEQRSASATTPSAPATSALPPAPERANFDSQEEFEEARGYWQSHIGRIKAMAARSKARASAASPPTSESTDE